MYARVSILRKYKKNLDFLKKYVRDFCFSVFR